MKSNPGSPRRVVVVDARENRGATREAKVKRRSVRGLRQKCTRPNVCARSRGRLISGVSSNFDYGFTNLPSRTDSRYASYDNLVCQCRSRHASIHRRFKAYVTRQTSRRSTANRLRFRALRFLPAATCTNSSSVRLKPRRADFAYKNYTLF